MQFSLEGHEFILLQSLLKACGLADTGGGAKLAITGGQVLVDGEVELRRGKKIRAGQVVTVANTKIAVTE